MVDQANRLKAAALIRQFGLGSITNDQFADALPCSNDEAIRAIRSMLWFCYSDLHEHRLAGKHALKPEWRDLFDRCVMFLNTDLEYTEETKFVSVAAPFERLWRWITRSREPELAPWWPFRSQEELLLHGRPTRIA